ncbi:MULTISPECIES: MarR family winged helix-turn-helix transcriptional regulator [Streptomyces]|uniref:MarR family winged helix-turn-helix transcriptional regulator n=1 Tax=Streptomyces TaxID=1883 RepID=UPI001CECCEA1|nr:MULTISPECIES: MarR family transcriptional regulator [Streptomyces]MDI6408713.1 MarR family transcriptional regulator [Streptomyces albus]
MPRENPAARKPAPQEPTGAPVGGTGGETAELAAQTAAAVAALGRRLRAASPAGALTPTQRSVLARILRTGPTTIAALARAELVRPQSMRVTVGALEERGVLTRSPHPTDGRQVVFALTEEGHQTLRAVQRAKHDWLTEALATRLDAAEQRTLAEAVVLLRRLVSEQHDGPEPDGSAPRDAG